MPVSGSINIKTQIRRGESQFRTQSPPCPSSRNGCRVNGQTTKKAHVRQQLSIRPPPPPRPYPLRSPPPPRSLRPSPRVLCFYHDSDFALLCLTYCYRSCVVELCQVGTLPSIHRASPLLYIYYSSSGHIITTIIRR